MSPPRIAINGRFLTQRASGVQRFATEAIKAIDVLLERDYAALKGRIELVAPRKARDFPLKNIPLRRAGFFSGLRSLARSLVSDRPRSRLIHFLQTSSERSCYPRRPVRLSEHMRMYSVRLMGSW